MVIWRAVSAGSREAEAELYRRVSVRARLYGLKHLGDEAAADDLAQDVWMMTLERLRAGRVREPDRIASFVLGTCACACAACGARRADKTSCSSETKTC